MPNRISRGLLAIDCFKLLEQDTASWQLPNETNHPSPRDFINLPLCLLIAGLRMSSVNDDF